MLNKQQSIDPPIKVKIIGVGGGGCNAIAEMAVQHKSGIEYLAVNTDTQALRIMDKIPTFAIGPQVTGGLGSGGNAALGRKAIRESQDQVAELLSGVDMVFTPSLKLLSNDISKS